MGKIKATIVVLLPVLIGISACYVCIAKCSPLAGKEGGFSFACYMMAYHGFMLGVVFPLALGSLVYVWRVMRSLCFKTVFAVLFLLFFVLLLIVPFGALRILWR